MTLAIYPGSFDPVTYGHLNVIERGAQIVDRLIAEVLDNLSKHSMFTMEERGHVKTGNKAHSQCGSGLFTWSSV